MRKRHVGNTVELNFDNSLLIQTPDGDVHVALVRLGKGRCRLAFTAARHLPIYREEVIQRMKAGVAHKQPE